LCFFCALVLHLCVRASSWPRAPPPQAGGEWLGRVTAAWQRGRLSNFDYLLYCNLAAGRSFNDLTQYPVFPWVLADYSSPALDLADPAAFRDLSRPVGALSPARLDAFRRRYADMAGDEHRPGGDPPFMYGTHYSCPGYTLHWLVRAAPGHMLRLQTGRFDAPDRLFCGVADAWASALSNPADVKELIPEFFMPGREDVLRNGRHLALGTRQSGRPVGDVELPPWAGGSPEAFLRLQRAALEAPCASANLHHWVDLVFGAKQAGAAAVEADNVFRHLAYEGECAPRPRRLGMRPLLCGVGAGDGARVADWVSALRAPAGAVDPQAIADPLERAAVEMAINEFGQCPRQIFRHPHPPRLVCPAPPEPAAAAAAAAEAPAEGGSGQSLSLALVSAIRAATCEDAAPAPSEVPALLRQLDMGRKRQEAADLALARQLQEEQQAAAAAAAAGARGGPPIQPPSPFAAGCNGLMGRLGALKDAVGEAAAAGRAAAAATAAAPAARSEGSGGGLEAAGSAPHSSQPLSSGGRLSSLAGSLSSRWQSFAGSRSASGGGAAPAAQSAAPPAPPSADAPAAESTAASGAGAHQEEPSLPWKFASHGGAARPPACSSDDEAEVGPGDGDGPVQGSSRLSDLPGGWGPGLRDRLRPGAALAAGSEAVNALALAAVGDGAFAYCACHDGSLRIFDLAAGRQTRAARLGAQPLASVALLPGAAAAAPLVLCGSYSSEILVYCPATGAPAGAFAPHADAVSCLEVVPGGGDGGGRLVTASWDCSVKVWDLGEGRQPWDSTLPQPAAAAGDLPGGVWALAVAADGATALAGTEEGAVLALDLRSPPAAAVAWERALSRDYIGGVCLLPDGRHALAAAADGALALLDLRRGGATVSAVAGGTPLRCCASDGATALAGGEAGGIVVWDVGQQLNRAPPAGAFTPPGIDGLYAPLAAEPASPVNALGVALLEAPGGAGAARLCVASAHESGALRPYWT
jgi:factor associated with neutral sphingomyelinase activation